MNEISKLQQLMQETGLWRANHLRSSEVKGMPTGFPELDPWLPDNGWPRASVTELLHPHSGIGELRLLAPALASLSQQQKRWIAWIGSPYIPYAPALIQAGINIKAILIIKPTSIADQLWAIEKSLASGACSAVLAWPDKGIQPKHIRRLQLASKAGQSWGLIFRSEKAVKQSSPASLRLHLKPGDKINSSNKSAICVTIIKRPGGWASGPIDIRFKGDLNSQKPLFPDITTPKSAPAGKLQSRQTTSNARPGKTLVNARLSNHLPHPRLNNDLIHTRSSNALDRN
ncbi:MAG: translesion DNA synthesis-associated protein ImuA [Gammaproteobacteria bacterium]|nr:translesion DNA synthesis-associated protein ImuA [Gammaproteobacteria bacterium]